MNFNQAPYFDDFDANSPYYKILFRPGVAVQTREVNQLQSMLQNQITKFGNHVFKEGSMVIPGQVNYNDNLAYVKLSTTTLTDNTQASLDALVGTVVAANSDGTGVKANVIAAVAATSVDSITLILHYISGDSGLAGTGVQTFAANQTLYVVGEATTLTVQGGSGVVGRSAVASMQSGVYYINGYFVHVPESTLVVQKYVTDASAIQTKIGLQYTESFVTEETDDSLYDNAAGSPNYAAPGAHRYSITTEFVSVGLDENPENFFELIRVETGVLQNIINASQYSVLEETLARRTFDESGNYVVENFNLEVKESRSNNRGEWSANAAYIVGDIIQSNSQYFSCVQGGTSNPTAPSGFSTAWSDNLAPTTLTDGATLRWRYTSNPKFNQGAATPENGGDSSNLVLTFGVGKAYVRGFEINKTGISQLTIPKSRVQVSSNNKTIYTPTGNYIYVSKTQAYGLPDVSLAPTVYFYDRNIGTAAAGFSKIGYGNRVGQARIKFIDTDVNGSYKLGLMAVKMEPGKNLEQDVNMVIVDTPGATTFTTSYALSGSGARYAGVGASNTSVTISGIVSIGAAQSGNAITITSTAVSAFTKSLIVGDIIKLGTLSTSVGAVAGTTSYTVVQIVNDASLVVSLASGNSGAQLTSTAIFVKLDDYTVHGMATSIASKFASELKIGDSINLGGTVTGTVRTILSENRLVLSSTTTTAQYWSGNAATVNVSYSGEVGEFAANVFQSLALNVNVKKLNGTFQLLDYNGGTASTPVHQALKIQGSNDARLFADIRVNDFLNINDNRIFVTKISSNTVAYGISLDSAITGSTVSYTTYKIKNDLKEPNDVNLVYPITNATSNLNDNIYYVYKTQKLSGVPTTSIVTVSLAAASGSANAEAVATTDVAAYQVSVIDSTNLPVPVAVNSVSVVGTTVTLGLASTVAGTVRVIWPVVKSSISNGLAGLKTKTLNFDTAYEVLNSSTALLSEIVLPNTDVYRIAKVLMTNTWVATWDATAIANAVDITTNYSLDDGQRDTFYDYSRLKLRPGSQPPSGSIKIYYDYFSHGAGDFFAFSSYDTNQVSYENIPDFSGTKLRDCLDYRSDIDGVTDTIPNMSVPRASSSFIADLAYYLARKEKVLLDYNKNFYNVSSTSAVTPEDPKVEESNNYIQLYDLSISAYTDSPTWPDVIFKGHDNRRYTMRDIGKLDRRVSNLEEVTSLSLLENQTKNLQIRDNKDSTLERYKTGIFVDNFSDLTNAAPDSDARFTVDPDAHTLNPHVSNYSFPLVEKLNYTADDSVGTQGGNELVPVIAARAAQNYRVTGDVLTIDYTTSTVLKQNLATTSISVAPFLSVSFLGNLKLTPESDVYQSVNVINEVKDDATNAQRYAEAVRLGQSLYGSRYSITPIDQTQLTDQKVTSVKIPYCRANTILLVATGLRPNTKFYSFIDNKDIRSKVTGAVKFTVSSVDNLSFGQYRSNVNNNIARWRSLAESRVEKQVSGSRRWVFVGWGSWWNVNRDSSLFVWNDRNQTFTRNGVTGSIWGGWWNTKLYRYVDDTKITLVRRTNNPADYETNMPSDKFTDSVRKALTGGVEVYYQEGGANIGSGIAVYQDKTTLYVVNARGKMSAKSIRAGNTSFPGTMFIGGTAGWNSTFPLSTLSAAQVCTDDTLGNLYSDDKGVICALIDLPDQDNFRILAGKKIISLSDSPTNDPDNFTSKAEATYTVQGANVTITNTYVTTKSYKARPIPHDPIAQSFKLPEQFKSGAFITDVDVFFQGKPVNEDMVVSLELRTCDSTGRPSEEILPGTQVVKGKDEITVDETKGQIPTKFTFDIPVHIQPEKNYAIVLKSDTKNYRVWIATLGQADVNNPNKSYSTQATLGSFFKSQDGTLWTEDQLSDLKFNINRAVFKTNVEADAYLVNQNIPTEPLLSNPLVFIHGSAKIRVKHPNHGLRNGDKIRLHSKYWAAQYTANNAVAINGIPVTEIFGTNIASELVTDTDELLTVSQANLDDYVITSLNDTVADLGAAALVGETAKQDGGADINVNSNVLYHAAEPSMKVIGFQETTMTMQAVTTVGHTYDNLPSSSDKYSTVTENLNINTTNFFNEPKVVLTDTNELAVANRYLGTNINGTTWTDSFIGLMKLSTTNNAVSPVIDLGSAYLNAMQHRIDNPSRDSRLSGTIPAYGTTSIFVLYSTVVSSDTTIAFNAVDNSIVSPTIGTFSNVAPGGYITISGAAINANNNTSTGVLVMDVSNDGTKLFISSSAGTSARPGITFTNSLAGSSITIRQLTDFTEESTTIDASGESKYITRKISLDNPATSLKIIMEVNIPSAADFDVYYKIGASNADFNNLVWTKYNNMPIINKSDTRGAFTDLTIDINDVDNSGNPKDLVAYSAFQVKFVMRSTNAARVPQFRNMRVIAHA